LSKDKIQHRRGDGSAVDASSLWFAFRRRWFTILFLGTALGIGAAYGVWRFLPQPNASANVIFEIAADPPTVLSRLPDDKDFNSFKQNQANLVTKRSVLAAILSDPGVKAIKECSAAKDPIRWLEELLKVDFKMGREYMRVTAELKSAEDALTLLRALQKNFMYEAVNKEKDRKEAQKAAQRSQYEMKSKALQDELTKLRELGKEGGAANDKIAALQQELNRQSLSDAQKERARLGSEMRRLRVELAGRSTDAAKADKVDPPERLIQAELEASTELKSERARLVDLEQKHKELKDLLAPGVVTQRLTQLEQAVNKQRNVVEELPRSLRAAAIEKARTKNFMAANTEKDSLQSRLATAEALDKELETYSTALGAEFTKLGTTQHDFEQSRVHINRLEKLTESLFNSLSKMDIEGDAPDRIMTYQEPTAVSPDNAARRLKFSGIAGLAGFVMGACPVWLITLRRKVFHYEAQLAEAVAVPLIGTIPYIPRKRRSHARAAVVAEPRMRAMVTESIDSTRATVLFKLQETGGRCIMVTSSVAGEAKSSVSGHIAISLARAGFRTLLVDSDMRRPTLHRVFGVKKSPGFSDVLLGRRGLGEVTQSCQVPNLYVLTAGDWAPAASSSLAGGAWQDLMAEAKQLFDVIIVDTPPVLLVADSLSMARDVDAVLLCALINVSEIDLIKRSINKLESLSVEPMGIIASGVSHRMYTSRYYDRYAAAYSQRVRN